MLIKKSGTMYKGRATMAAAPGVDRDRSDTPRSKGIGGDQRRHTWSDGGLASLVNTAAGPEAGAGGTTPDAPGAVLPQHRYVGFSVNLHQFPYVAKNALHMLQSDCFPRMLTNVGLVIEGREEAELPEAMLGCVRLVKIRKDQAWTEEAFFNS